MRQHNFNRRRFLKFASVSTGAGIISSIFGCGDVIHQPESSQAALDDAGEDRYLRFAVLADTHIIDEFYDGQESSDLDTSSLYLAADRLTAARDIINSYAMPIDLVLVAGDVCHNYPSQDPSFYETNTTRFDIAAQILDGFDMPVHVGFGNHDYDFPTIPKQFSNELYQKKFGIEPFYSISAKGWNFIHLNNFLGSTMDPSSPDYNQNIGSFGEEQLSWLESELQTGEPSFLVLHYPLATVAGLEFKDFGLMSLLHKYRDTIAMVFAGHTHQWMNFGDLHGPLHLVVAATRYDQDSFLLVEVDTQTGVFDILNWNHLHWGSKFTKQEE